VAQNASHSYHANELDLGELIRTLWASKVLILAVVFVVTALAVTYAFLSKPIYQTTVQTLPPTASGLASYNIASQLTGGAISGIVDGGATPLIEPLTPQGTYKTFLRHLNSSSTRQRFFEEYYLPAKGNDDSEAAKQRAWKRLNNELTIVLPVGATEYEARLTLEGEDPHVIAEWANAYVDLAIQTTREDLLNDLTGQVKIRKQSLEDQISTLREVARTTRQARITRLEGALAIAEAIDLEQPPTGTPLITVGNRSDIETFSDGGLLYLRGTKALKSELQLLKERQNDDAYIVELPDVLKKLALLNGISLDPALLSVTTIDRAAIAPEDPVKPKKLLVVLLGIILGGMLGIFIALARRVLQPNKLP